MLTQFITLSWWKCLNNPKESLRIFVGIEFFRDFERSCMMWHKFLNPARIMQWSWKTFIISYWWIYMLIIWGYFTLLPSCCWSVPKNRPHCYTLLKLNNNLIELEILNWFLILQHEATKVMQDALHEFGGTPEEVR